MKNILITILLVFSFSACSNIYLSYDIGGKFSLNDDKNSIIIGDNVKRDALLNFRKLYVSQYSFLSEEGNKLFAESAETDDFYEFYYSELYVAMYAFNDSKNYEIVYRKGNIHLVQIKLEDNSYVNVLVQGNCMQNYIFVYGFSNKEFLKIANEMKLKDTKIIQPKFKAVTFNEESKPQTKWNDLLRFFELLVAPLEELRVR